MCYRVLERNILTSSSTHLFLPPLFILSFPKRSLRIEVDANGVQHSQISRKAVPMIVSVLRWLHRASERTGNALPEDFYSEAVDRVPLEALFEDLRALKKYASQNQKPSTFLICASPFLIPPSKKRDLLLIESQVQMMKAATQDASINVSDGT